MKKILALAVISFCAATLKAQTITKDELTKTVMLADSTAKKKLYLPVTSNMVNLNFFFISQLSHGSISVEIEDPEGKNEGGFQLTTDPSPEGEKGTKGQMAHNVNFPIQGNWVISVQFKHATGKLSYEIKPSYK